MAGRVAMLDETGERRIFRVDKHPVPDDEIPEPLRKIQAVRFYRGDDETGSIEEYYWRGKVRLSREYKDAVHKLAVGIATRLNELAKSGARDGSQS